MELPPVLVFGADGVAEVAGLDATDLHFLESVAESRPAELTESSRLVSCGRIEDAEEEEALSREVVDASLCVNVWLLPLVPSGLFESELVSLLLSGWSFSVEESPFGAAAPEAVVDLLLVVSSEPVLFPVELLSFEGCSDRLLDLL